MRRAARAGVKPAEFWSMCPAELAAVTEGERWRLEQQRTNALISGWCSEVFARWKGRLPSIAEALEKILGVRRRAGPEGAHRVREALRQLARQARRRSDR